VGGIHPSASSSFSSSSAPSVIEGDYIVSYESSSLLDVYLG